MAHELEQFNDGSTAFVSGNNIDPWHRLGTVLPTGLTADQALELAYLRDWDVRKVQALTTLEQITADGVTTDIAAVPGQFAIVRTNPFTKKAEPLGTTGGVVGTKYQPFQNEQAVEFLAAVTNEYSDAEFETAGSIRGGTQVFVSMKLTNFMIGGVDAHNMYLVYLLNHATGANQAFPTTIRVVCANTADWAVQSARYTFRHSASIEARHQEARDALKMSFNYNAMFQAAAESMLKQAMDLDEFRKVCDGVWPQPDAEAADLARKRWDERRSQLRQLFVFADTQENIRFTKWGAFNAIVEYQDHVASSRGNSAAEKAEVRALRTIDGSPVKEKAFALLSA